MWQWAKSLGSRMLEYVSERAFVRLYKTVLTLVAIRLIAAVLISL